MSKAERAAKANEFLEAVAACGRRFFHHEGRVSRFEVDPRGRVWFIDKYTQKRIYTHFEHGRWSRFSEGGTLKTLVLQLRDFIRTGTPPSTSLLGPWPPSYCNGDLWGYGEDMKLVREAAARLGVLISSEA